MFFLTSYQIKHCMLYTAISHKWDAVLAVPGHQFANQEKKISKQKEQEVESEDEEWTCQKQGSNLIPNFSQTQTRLDTARVIAVEEKEEEKEEEEEEEDISKAGS